VSGPPLVRRISAARRHLREIAWLPPVLAAIVGCGLALAIDAGEGPADPRSIAISVDRARDSTWAGLALLFTALSVVMAVVTLTAQNMASRFSPRLLRVKLLLLSERLVLVLFSFTASYLLTVLLLNRSRLPDDPARPLELAIGAVLLVASSISLIWYINRMLQSLRVDRTVRWVAGLILEAARKLAQEHREDVELPADALDAPPGAVDVTAIGAGGYLVGADIGHLHRLAVAHDVVIATSAEIGQLVVPGDRIGWISGSDQDQALSHMVAESFDVAVAHDPNRDVDYDIHLLVDISLMALSKGVNDPHTAEQCVDQLTLVLPELAEQRPGPRGRLGRDHEPIVMLNLPTLGSQVERAFRRILLYGNDDPIVSEALLRLARQLERVGPREADRRTARALSAEITQASSTAGT
jgi:uncharacterized membrane protein